METLGDRMRERRKVMHLSQDALAAGMDLKSGKQTIYSWEKGHTEPSLSDIRKMAMVLDCGSGWLVDGKPHERVVDKAPIGYVLILSDDYIELQSRVIKLLEERNAK